MGDRVARAALVTGAGKRIGRALARRERTPADAV